MDRTSQLERIDNEHTNELTERGFEVYRGWNDTLAAKIVDLSRQDHILETTRSDAERRFRTLHDARIWHAQGRRSVYTLHGEDVSGLIWYDIRPRNDLGADYTFAIRTYEEARGNKLAHGFMRAAHHDFAERKGNPPVWLDVASNNEVARHLYRKFGYQVLYADEGRDVMIYDPGNHSERRKLGAF